MTTFLPVAIAFFVAMTSHSAVSGIEAERIPQLRRALLTIPPGDTPVPTPAPTTMPASTTVTDHTYFFGSVQIKHPNFNDKSLPEFVHALSAAANVTSLMDGEWRESKKDPIPPENQWKLNMSCWKGTFKSSNYDSVVYTDYPTAPYPPLYKNEEESPLDQLLKVVDYASESDPTTVIYLYESWKDPAVKEEWKLEYYESMNASSSYHQWWVDLHSNVTALRHKTDIRLVPVAPIMASVLSSEYMVNVMVHDLFYYSRGIEVVFPTVYFIAALILYMAKYEQRPSSSYGLPQGLNQNLVDNYDAIVHLIYEELFPPVPSNPSQPTPESSPPLLPDDTPGPNTTKTDRTYFFASDQIFNWKFRRHGNAVPHYVNLLSAAANVTSLMDGEWRDRRTDPIPPEAQWKLNMSCWNGTFNSSNYDSVVYTDYDNIQDSPPTAPYKNAEGAINEDEDGSPLDRLLKVVNYVSENDPTTVIYLYEIWKDLGSEDLPGLKEEEKLAYYQSMNAHSSYHQWWVDLHSNVTALRNKTDIRLVPVAPIMASVLSSEYMVNVTVNALFYSQVFTNRIHTRNSPTVYFIAALILYMAKYEQRPVSFYMLDNFYENTFDTNLLPDLKDNYYGVENALLGNYDAIVDLIYDELYPLPCTAGCA